MVHALVFEKPKEYKVSTVDQDGLWKKVIAEMFEEFMLFFLPDLYTEIDFTQLPDFLQQELYKEIIEEKKGRKIADQIVKVHLKDGQEKWILIHIEVQSDSNPDFPKRMFQYFYRIYDRYEREVVAVAIQTGASKQVIPNTFEYSYFGTTIRYECNNFILMAQNERELEQSPNLFSKVVLTAIYLNKTRYNADKRFVFKLRLLRKLLRDENVHRGSIPALLYFIDYSLRLPDEFNEPLEREIRMEAFHLVQFNPQDIPPTFGALMENERKQGMEEGLEQGMIGERRSLACKLIKKGYDNEEIAEIIPLSVEEIENLRSMQ